MASKAARRSRSPRPKPGPGAESVLAAAGGNPLHNYDRAALVDDIQQLVEQEKQVLQAQLEARTRELEAMRERLEKLQSEHASDVGAVVSAASSGANVLGLSLEQCDFHTDVGGGGGRSLSHAVTTMDMSGGRFRPGDIVRLVHNARLVPALTAVDLSRCALSDTDTKLLDSVLATAHMRGVDLSHNLLGDKALRSVTQSLTRNPHLVWLNLAHNDELGCTPTLGSDLASALARCTTLTHLEVSVRDTPASATAAVVGAAVGVKGKSSRKAARARAAKAARDSALAKGGRARGSKAAKSATSKRRGRGGSSPSEQLVSALASGAKHNSLVSIALPGSELRKGVVSTLVRGVAGLTALDLSACFVGAFGVEAIAAALPRTGTLTSLNLSYCGLNDLNASLLFEALQGTGTQNMSLTSLDVSNNDLADGVAEDIADALRTNRVLTALDLSGNPIGPRGGAALVSLLRQSPTLLSLGRNVSLPPTLRQQSAELSAEKRSVVVRAGGASASRAGLTNDDTPMMKRIVWRSVKAVGLELPLVAMPVRKQWPLPVNSGHGAGLGAGVSGITLANGGREPYCAPAQPSVAVLDVPVSLGGDILLEWRGVFCATSPDHVFAWQLAKVDVACYDTVGRVVAAGDHTDAFPSRVDARFEAQKRYIGLRGGGGARADTIGDLADVLDEVEDQAGGDASAPRKSRRRTRLAPTPLFSRLVSAQGDGTTSVRGSSAVVYSPRWFAVVVPGCPAGCTLRLHMWASNVGCDDPAAPGQALGATAVAHITHASAGGVLADPPDMTVSSGAGASSAGHRAASPPLAWSFTS